MLFGEHFVKDSLFVKQAAKAFHELFLLRQNSDYKLDEDISESDTMDVIEVTTEFLLQTEAYLRAIEYNS